MARICPVMNAAAAHLLGLVPFLGDFVPPVAVEAQCNSAARRDPYFLDGGGMWRKFVAAVVAVHRRVGDEHDRLRSHQVE